MASFSESEDSDVSSSYVSDGEIPCSYTKGYDLDGKIEDKDEFQDNGYFACFTSKEDFAKLESCCSMKAKGTTNIFPEGCEVCLNSCIHAHLRSLVQHEEGFIFIKSPLFTFCKSDEDVRPPKGVICDAFVFVINRPAMVLTFVTDDPVPAENYNASLARHLTVDVRRQTNTNFQLVHGIFERTLWESDKFDIKLRELEHNESSFAIPDSAILHRNILTDVQRVFLNAVRHQSISKWYTEMFSRFVKTSAYEEASSRLKETDLLILTGGPGEGKSIIGHRLCYDYLQQCYNIIFYNGEEDFNVDKLITTDFTLVVLDNVLSDSDLLKYLVSLDFSSGSRKFRIVIIASSYDLKRAVEYNCEVFSRPTVTDLTSTKKVDTKRTMEDFSQLMKMFSIDEGYIDKPPMLYMYVGFPKILKHLSKVKSSSELLSCIIYPHEFFHTEMNNILCSDAGMALMYVILCGGRTHIPSHITDHKNTVFDDDLMYEEDTNEMYAIKALQSLFPNVHHFALIGELRCLVGTYLDVRNDIIVFEHQVIYDACVFAIDVCYPGFLWKHCEPVFKRYSDGNKVFAKPQIFISEEASASLVSRLVDDTRRGKLKHTFNHPVLTTKENTDMFCGNLFDGSHSIFNVEDDNLSILYWIVKFGTDYLRKTVLDVHELSQEDVNEVLIHCIQSDQTKEFLFLREQLKHIKRQDIGYKTDSTDSDGNTFLMMALEKNNGPLIEVMMNDSENLNVRNSDSNTSLHIACHRGNTRVVKYLLPKMLDSKDLPGQELRTPVMIAAMNGHVVLYEYLATTQKCCLNGIDVNGDSILHLACIGGSLKIVKDLLSCAIFEKNQRGQFGRTPLMISAYWGHRDLFEWLLEQKCHISTHDFVTEDLLSSGHLGHAQYLNKFLQAREYGICKYVCKCFHGQDMLKMHLQSKGSNMLLIDESGMNLLHTAANAGHMELAYFLLSKGNVNINSKDVRGRTPVMLAAAAGHTLMFEFLLNRCDLALKDAIGRSVLHYACEGGSSVILETTMDRGFTDVNSADNYGKTPLSISLENGSEPIFNILLNKGANALVVDKDCNTSLHFACTGGNLTLVQLLMSAGICNINAVNREHRTPLLEAAHGGHETICYYLICQDADLHVQDRDGNDVLQVAALKGAYKTVYSIMQIGEISSLSRDKSGKTSTMKAAENGRAQIFYLLSECFPDLSPVDKEGSNILHLACRGGNEGIVEYILSQNTVDINCGGENGKTPVIEAAERGHKNIFELLVCKGCDLYLQSRFGYNILHAACHGGNYDIVTYVLNESKVDINSTTKYKWTPVMQAALKGHRAVFDLLVTKKCDLSMTVAGGYSILHAASHGGSVGIVQYILSQQIVDINSRSSRIKAPLTKAAMCGHGVVFDLLVSNGSDLAGTEHDGTHILHAASQGGNVNIVRYILNQKIVDLNKRDCRGRTPLRVAEVYSHHAVSEMLKRRGAK